MRRGILVAALPGELGPLTRGWRRERGLRSARHGLDLWILRRDGAEFAAACSGAGAEAAARAFAAAEAALGGPPDWAVSLGWAGALDPALRAGEACRVAEVVDAAGGERFAAEPLPGAAPSPSGARLLSVAKVAGLAEKRRLRDTQGADLVDMEAAAVAGLARGRGLPFYCVKGVSDAAGTELPDFKPFLDAGGRFRTARFAVHAALRPALWPGLVGLGVHSGRAAKAMARALAPLLA